MVMREPIVELRGVTKAFGKKVILNNVDLKVYEGEAIGVIGPSGTGKSTILRLVAGLLAPDRGEVYIYGTKRQRTEIRDLVEEKLDLVGMSGSYDLYPAEISGGMRKRVSLARAIISDPSIAADRPNILLYDEPTAGLDPVASTRIQTVIMELLKVKKACGAHLIVTHVHSTIENTTDRIVFLYKGQFQWVGPTQEAYHSEIPVLKQFFTGSIHGPIQ
jgi:phospholipid/cholesterol/gamma-HCH transport system ATP-binding protein